MFLESPISSGTNQWEAYRDIGAEENAVGVNNQKQSLANQQRLESAGDEYMKQYSTMGSGALTQGYKYGRQALGSGQYNQLQAQQDQNAAMSGVHGYENNVGNFLNQGPGPSVAQAQLRQGNDQNVANMMAMANSGRGQGANAAAAQQAMFSGAAAGQQLNQQQAILRAQEAQAWRQQQLQGMGMQLQGYGMQSDVAQARAQNALAQQQMGQQAIQQGQAQNLQANQLGQSAAFNWAQMGQSAAQQDQALREQMYAQNLNASNAAAIANQQDTEKSNAAAMGAIGGLLGGGGSMLGGLF